MNPIIYNSYPLKIGTTPYDDKWKSSCRPVALPPELVQFLKEKGTNPISINWWVNHSIGYRNDIEDIWSPPGETLKRGYGDCEDFAILKYHILKQAGFDTRNMFLVIGKNLVLRQDHVVLVVYDGKQFIALDNLTDSIIPTIRDMGFVPIISLNEHGSWIFGKKV